MPPASVPHSAKRPARRTDEPPAPAAPPAASILLHWLPLAVVAAATLLFVILKLYAVNVVVGDEHLYFNMAVLVNKGLIPHRDFFYTHPPLHLYLAVLVFKLFGYSLALGKALTSGSLLIGGLLVFTIGRRTLGAAEGAVACAIFLLSFDPLRISSHFTGGNETFAFAMIGLWLAFLDRPLLAGVAFGLGALVAIYIAPGAGAVALMLWWRSRRAALRFVGAALAVVLCGNLLMYALAGWDFVYQVYLTQFLKGKEGSLVAYTLYDRLGYIMYENRMLTAGAVAGVVLLALDARSRLASVPARRHLWQDARGEALLLFVAWFALYWTFYLSIKLQHAYYFLFIMPIFAWLSAYAYVGIGRGLARAVRPTAVPTRADQRAARRRAAPAPRADRLTPLIPAAVALVLTLANVGVIEALYVPFALHRYGTGVSRYTWQPLRHLTFIDPWVRAAFWQPQYTAPHPPAFGITRYLQHESDQIVVADQIYAAVKQHSTPDETIFGEVGFVPIVSSETGRRIAANLVDTSSYRISYGLSRIEDWIAAIEADHVQLLVVRQGMLPMRYPQFRDYAVKNFQTVARIRDPQQGVFEIMRRVAP
jgi:hypothetical protein